MYEWNYKSESKVSTGYEDLYPVLEKYTKELYMQSSDEDKCRMIEEVCDIYQNRGIFPIDYLNEEGIREDIQRCIDFDAKVKDGVVNTGAGVGTKTCNMLFPNMYGTKNVNNITEYFKGGENAYGRFHTRKFLRNAVKFAIEFGSESGIPYPSCVMAGIRMGGAMASNFRPMNAKALYEKYTPKNGVIFDYACGFGGRLLGALSSKNNYTYIGTDPNSETFENLNTLGRYIESVTGRKNSYRILKIGSENFKPSVGETVDYAFSSPPYFNLEQYTEEKTQCYNKFPDIYDWFEGYVRETIKNIYHVLKHDRYYSVNIADFNCDGKVINYVDTWKRFSLEAGFEFHEELRLRIPKRTHGGESKSKGSNKEERIITFYKR